MSFNCPVCSKSGLPNYNETAITCPQCNSDLKSYYLLNAIKQETEKPVLVEKSKEEEPSSPKINYLLLGLLCLSFLGLATLWFTTNSQKAAIAEKYETQIAILQKEAPIKTPSTVVTKTDTIVMEIPTQTINYTVKRGDYLYKIARMFYNDGSKYSQIKKDNNLTADYLEVGQNLVIQLNIE